MIDQTAYDKLLTITDEELDTAAEEAVTRWQLLVREQARRILQKAKDENEEQGR